MHLAAMSEIVPLMCEQLAAGGTVRFSPRGVSMLPMLREGLDSVELSPVPDRLQRFDIPLYRRRSGEYVLHRVVAEGETYTCMGDNQYVPETGLAHEQMIAVVTAFYRKNKRCSMSGLGYRVYCYVWHYSRNLRHFLGRCIRFLKRRLS